MDPAVVDRADGQQILVSFAPEGVLKVVQVDVGIAADRTDRGRARTSAVFGQPPPSPAEPGRDGHVGEVALAVPATIGGPSGTWSWGPHSPCSATFGPTVRAGRTWFASEAFGWS